MTSGTSAAAPLLAIRELEVSFGGPAATVRAVRGVNLEVAHGEVMGLVGESGSGKSVTAMSILGLHDRKRTTYAGSIRLAGSDVLGADERELSKVRGKTASMVFQDPMTALNPVLSIGTQLVGVLRAHHPEMSKQAARRRAVELLSLVNIPRPQDLTRYPHELSGGMRQRVMIAMAIANDPMLIVADEPTTALDVTIQDQVLRILKRAKDETGAGVLLITHDLGVVADMCDRVAVMYAGRVVETAPVEDLFQSPGHPYTRALMRSRPLMSKRTPHLEAIPGNAVSGESEVTGCRFHPRCARSDATAGCMTIEPLLAGPSNHPVACHRARWVVERSQWLQEDPQGDEVGRR